jgi:hypothetical protein
MTNIKMFIIGALLGTILGATFLGAIAHFLLIGLAVVGAATATLAIRRHRLPKARAHKDLKHVQNAKRDGRRSVARRIRG